MTNPSELWSDPMIYRRGNRKRVGATQVSADKRTECQEGLLQELEEVMNVLVEFEGLRWEI